MRQELFPFSDIDLMILYRPGIATDVGKITDAVLYPLWDTGLDVGHGVRTVQESLQHAGDDFFFRVLKQLLYPIVKLLGKVGSISA